MAEEWEDCPDTDAEWAILDLDGFSAEAVKESAKQHGGVSLIGLDSPTPFLRIGNMHFKGSYDAPLGSDLIFATSANQAIQPRLRDIVPTVPRYGLANAIFNKANTTRDPNLAYMGAAETHVKFHRIRLETKTGPIPAGTASSNPQVVAAAAGLEAAFQAAAASSSSAASSTSSLARQ